MIKPGCEDTFLKKRRDLKNNYYSFTFGPYSRVTQCRPGNFIHLQMPKTEILFRRAMSVAGVDTVRKELEIIFKVYGRGTKLLSNFRVNDRINILGPLGNTFQAPRKNEKVIIVAGGVGFPPLLYFTRHLLQQGFLPGNVEFFYGGRSTLDLIERARIRKLGVQFHPVTDDGSFGRKGLVTEAVEDYILEHRGEKMRLYGCGPEAMLKTANSLGLKYELPGQLSLEAPMPCGVGICLGCVVPLTAGGYARVCADGPVFEIGEVAL
ncbi:MAG: dihydroorotate dehydrogenase electron transfer subunit [Candidatus Zixiibacteriota bacterium]